MLLILQSTMKYFLFMLGMYTLGTVDCPPRRFHAQNVSWWIILIISFNGWHIDAFTALLRVRFTRHNVIMINDPWNVHASLTEIPLNKWIDHFYVTEKTNMSSVLHGRLILLLYSILTCLVFAKTAKILLTRIFSLYIKHDNMFQICPQSFIELQDIFAFVIRIWLAFSQLLILSTPPKI